MNFIPKSNKELATFIYQLASLIEHRDFLKLIRSTEHRFKGVAPFMSKIIVRRSNDVVESIASIALREADSLSLYRNIHAMSDLNELKGVCQCAAENLSEIAGLIAGDEVVKQADRKFSCSRDSNFIELAHSLFGTSLAEKERLTINEFSNPGSELYRRDLRASYLTDLIFNVGAYLRARLTLSASTGINAFETLLDTLLPLGEEFWVHGYPYDVLVHDLNVMIEHSGLVRAIAIRDEKRLSTFAAFEKSEDTFDYRSGYPLEFCLKRQQWFYSETGKPALKLKVA